MKALGHILLLLTACAGTAAVAAENAKSPAILLQEAIYQEETEGNLDKAIELYGQVLEQAAETERLAARATYQLGLCHLKKGDQITAAKYFRKVRDYPKQASVVKKAQAELDKLQPEDAGDSMFEHASGEIWSTLGQLYSMVCARAGLKNLYCNSSIHLVESDFVHWTGGYGYYMNMTPEPVSGRVRLLGTTVPNQKHYDVMGNRLDTEIVADETAAIKGYYSIFLNLPQPVAPGGLYPYAWQINGSTQVAEMPFSPEKKHILTMQNQFGAHAFEVFYLIVPDDMKVEYEEKSAPVKMEDGSLKEAVIEKPTIQPAGNYIIYAWEKELQPDDNHVVTVYLSKKENNAQNWVEDFFKHNYRDITARTTLEWGEPKTDEKGNISIRYKYEATIWDKDKIIEDKVWTFDKEGKFLSVRKVGAEDIYSLAGAQALVEDFFADNYRDITQRKTIEWGEPIKHENGNISIRYKCEATIWDKEKKILDQTFTFDKDGKFVSAADVK